MDTVIAWLLDHAGPVIRYRVLTELCGENDESARAEALRALLALPEMQRRLAQLARQDIDRIHGATADCFENALPMVLDFGLNAAVPEFCRCLDLPHIIRHYESVTAADPYKWYYKKIMYPLFVRAGYRQAELLAYITQRIDRVSQFTDAMDYAIYDDPEKFKGMPKTYRDRPVVKPALFVDYDYLFPQIYDIIGFAEVYRSADADCRRKIDSIIRYIVAPEYNSFAIHYGAIQFPDKRYAAIGWDCLLPLYDADRGHQSLSMYLHRLEIFSHFPRMVHSEWFHAALARFEQCKTPKNTYVLGKDYLIEQRDRCWFMGAHLGLGEDRRKDYQEAESTFRILKIKRNAEACLQMGDVEW